MATKLRITKKRFEELVEEEVKAYRKSSSLITENVTQGLFAQLIKTYSKRVREFEQDMRTTFEQLGLDGSHDLDEKEFKRLIKKLTAHYFKFSSKLDKITNELLALEKSLNLQKSEDDVLPPQELDEENDNGDNL